MNLQILDWDFGDIIPTQNSTESSNTDTEDSDESSKDDYKNNTKFTIQVFGRNNEGESVSVIIHNFTPFFYIKVFDNWNKKSLACIDDHIMDFLPTDNKQNYLGSKLIKRHDFIGFTNKKKFNFIKLEFSNLETMNKCKYHFKYPIKLNGFSNDIQFKMYESNIMPMLRFIHINEISASGWIQIDEYTIDDDATTTCNHNISTDWNYVKPVNSTDISPVRVASYDIEADSSHGDFPVAKKNYKKLAMNVIDAYIKIKQLAKKKDTESIKLLENKNKLLVSLISYGLDGIENKYDIEKIFLKNNSFTKKDIENIISLINPNSNNRDSTITYSKKYIHTNDNKNESTVIISSIFSKKTYKINTDSYDDMNMKKFMFYFGKDYDEDIDDSCVFSYQNKIINLESNTLHQYKGCQLYLTQNMIYKYPEVRLEKYLPDNKLTEKISLKERVIWQWNNGGWWIDMSAKESKIVEGFYKKGVDFSNITINYNGEEHEYDIYTKKKILISLEETYTNKIIKIRRHRLFDGVKYNDNIYKIKQRIEDEFKIPLVQQCIMFNGIELSNEKKLNHYQYFRGGLLHLTIMPFIDETQIKRDDKISAFTKYLDKYLPDVMGDRVIQIGTVIQKMGQKGLFKHIVTLNGCDPIDGVEIESYESEKEVILAWGKLIQKQDPDIITGYNIFGFDFSFIWDRAIELNCETELSQLLGRVTNTPSYLKHQTLSSSAYGDNEMSYIYMKGRIQMDLLKVIQRDHNLDSYKLDSVSSNFIKGNIISKCVEYGITKLTTNNIIGLTKNNYITLSQDDSKYQDGKKLLVIDILEEDKSIIIDGEHSDINTDKHSYKWGLSKDDVSPKEIFELQKKGDKERAIIAKYCVQDCVLCLHLVNKLDIITNNMGMSNVCYVPLSFIFLRGQGIKTTSLVAEKCRKLKYLLPDRDSNDKLIIEARKIQKKFNSNTSDLEKDILEELLDILINEEPISNFDRRKELKEFPKLKELYQKIISKTRDGYEGAIVLKPYPDIYYSPISVLDYASLYPSSMISDNLSHDTIIKVGDKYIQDTYIDKNGGIGKYDNLEGYEYVDVTYDNYLYVPKGKQWEKIINEEQPTITCRYVQPKKTIIDGEEVIKEEDRGIIPQILNNLLTARKEARKKIKTETDPFKKSVLDGLQLAYKITANSIYGQIGASTSTIYFKEIAASTTAVGRKMLFLAKDYVESNYPGAKVVYGDTDSIFIKYKLEDDNGKPLEGKEALKKSIELGVETEKGMKSLMKKPHNLEYEKTFYPFCLLSKKRYVGRKYEFDLDKYVLNAMGIVLKRRDNAAIVKYVYGGIIDRIMAREPIQNSIDFLQKSLMDLLNGKFSIDYLIISKSLRTDYKNPDQIAHKVLADRMGERDPGNKPKPSDRIPYAYIEYKAKKGQPVLQGDKVEHPSFIQENNLKLDYQFYITNQIMKPVCQIYALIQDKPEKLFAEALRIADNRKNNHQEITKWFQSVKPPKNQEIELPTIDNYDSSSEHSDDEIYD